MYKAVGGVWCSWLGMIVFVPVALLVPVASLLPSTHAAVLPVLFLGMAVNSVADLAAYSGSNVLVSPRLDFHQRPQLCHGDIKHCRAHLYAPR